MRVSVKENARNTKGNTQQQCNLVICVKFSICTGSAWELKQPVQQVPNSRTYKGWTMMIWTINLFIYIHPTYAISKSLGDEVVEVWVAINDFIFLWIVSHWFRIHNWTPYGSVNVRTNVSCTNKHSSYARWYLFRNCLLGRTYGTFSLQWHYKYFVMWIT